MISYRFPSNLCRKINGVTRCRFSRLYRRFSEICSLRRKTPSAADRIAGRAANFVEEVSRVVLKFKACSLLSTASTSLRVSLVRDDVYNSTR